MSSQILTQVKNQNIVRSLTVSKVPSISKDLGFIAAPITRWITCYCKSQLRHYHKFTFFTQISKFVYFFHHKTVWKYSRFMFHATICQVHSLKQCISFHIKSSFCIVIILKPHLILSHMVPFKRYTILRFIFMAPFVGELNNVLHVFSVGTLS